MTTRVRWVIPFRGHAPGDETELFPGVAAEWIRRRFCELADGAPGESEAEIECMAVEAPERAVAARPRARRARRQKASE